MFFKRRSVSRLILAILALLAFITRFYKLDWGEGFFFHPDELNMAVAVTRMSPLDFDPRFYAYGQFPLFLTYFSVQISKFFSHEPISLSQAVIGLRFWSAIFSLISVYIFFHIGKNLFKKSVYPLIFTFLIIFTPGLIQLSHFGTTESLLILIFAANILISLKLINKNKLNYKLIFVASALSGVAISTKISSLILTGPIFLSFLLIFLKKKKLAAFFKPFLIFTTLSLLFSILSSPYNLKNINDYRSTLSYETAVALGSTQVFYTNQFRNTTPYLFQLIRIFPYTQGLLILPLSALGLFFLFKKIDPKWSLVLIPSLVYFLYFGQIYVKWTRFMSPVFFIFPLLATYFFSVQKNYKLTSFLIMVSAVPGLYFFKSYFQPDTRLQANNWLIQNIPPEVNILSESGNIVNLPHSDHRYHVNNFDFYTLEDNPLQLDTLAREIRLSDYIIVPSRRVFKNQTGTDFPISHRYYSHLFSGGLGFSKIKQFEHDNSFLLDPEKAEETWSVFDNPTVRIFKKTNSLPLEQYQQTLGGL